jgi:broad specificity phosphatase PhoE
MHIALVRHGKPLGAHNPIVDASGFARWAHAYERSRLRDDSVPPGVLTTRFQDYLAVASSLPRSLHSALLCLGREPDLCLADLREMEIPRYRIPVRIPAYAWLGLNRAIWMLGCRGRVESFREAKARARRVSLELHRLALSRGQIVVFGHSLMNRHVAASLLALGWNGRPRRTSYWEVIDLRKAPPAASDHRQRLRNT